MYSPNINYMVAKNRQYVAMVWKNEFDGFYFCSFTLPSSEKINNVGAAAEYFYNKHIKPFGNKCLERVITASDYKSLKKV